MKFGLKSPKYELLVFRDCDFIPGILFQFGPLKICRSDEKREAQMVR